MVAVPVQQAVEAKPSTADRHQAARSTAQRSLELIQGSLSARTVDRRAPWLTNLHRLADGSLLGLGVAVLGLSGLTLHWQGQWTNNFQKLEADQRLEHRLLESAAVLEQHHLTQTRKPSLLEPTSSEKLVYVDPPQHHPVEAINTLLAQVTPRQILPGY